MCGTGTCDYTVWPPLPGYAYAYNSYKKGKLVTCLFNITLSKRIISGAHALLGLTVNMPLVPGMRGNFEWVPC